MLGGHPVADDVALVVTELSANAIKHTASGGPGGRFVVELERCDSHVQVTVTDMGAGTEPALSAADPASETAVTGRGLFLVDALAVKWGCEQMPGGRHVWAILMEAEARAILTDAVSEPSDAAGLFTELLDRFGTLGGVDLELPVRHEPARAADFNA